MPPDRFRQVCSIQQSLVAQGRNGRSELVSACWPEQA